MTRGREKGDEANASQRSSAGLCVLWLPRVSSVGTRSFWPGGVTRAPEQHGAALCKASGPEVEAVLSEGERRALPFPWEQTRTAWNSLGGKVWVACNVGGEQKCRRSQALGMGGGR